MKAIHLSIVIPVYQCAPCIKPLFERLKKSVEDITSDWEVIFVDDHSKDDAWAVLENLYKNDSHVSLIQLSRNFGQHAAITAGLTHAQGDWIVVMDCDLQDPPEEIHSLYKKAQEGFEIVYTERIQKTHNLFRKFSSWLYSSILTWASGQPINHKNGSFSLISKNVAQSYLALGDLERDYIYALFWLGYKRAVISYQHGLRHAGESSYTLASLIRHAFSGIFFQTTILLRLVVYSGFAITFSSITLALFFIWDHFHRGSYPGWTSLAVLILLVGGVITTSVGVCALYIGRIFDQVKDRPLYIIARKLEHKENVNGLRAMSSDI